MLINFACPNCNEPHGLADSFAGGVYRCSKCNTLMSVPKVAAKKEFKPSFPKAQSPDELEAQSSASASGQVSRAPAGKVAASAGSKYRWPMVGVGASVVVLAVVLACILMRGGGKQKPVAEVSSDAPVHAPVHAQAPVVSDPPSGSPQDNVPALAFEYVPGVLARAKINVLGLPLAGNAAVIIDGDRALDRVRADLHFLLADGLGRGGAHSPVGVTLHYATGEEPMPTAQFKAGDPFSSSEILKFLDRDRAYRDWGAPKHITDLIIRQGREKTASHVFLIVGHSIGKQLQNALRGALGAGGDASDLRIDIIVVGADVATQNSGALATVAKMHHGRMVRVPLEALKNAAVELRSAEHP